MATTSLWHIKGSLKDLVDYVENPNKTIDPSMRDFFDVFAYAQNPNKTKNLQYVTAINCVREIALQQMILTKKQFAKDDGYIAWHGYQSFKPGEVTPDECHAIGVQTARELWGDSFQIIVTTHLDKEHLHNHFCLNSVGFRDGWKYNYSKAERQRMMEISDRICKEHGLSVITKQHKAPSRPVWQDEKQGKPTRYNIYREDVYTAMAKSNDIRDMIRYLQKLGYDVDFSGEKWKLKLGKYKYYTHLETLNPKWTPYYFECNLGKWINYYSIPAKITFTPYLPREYWGTFERYRRTSEIYRLYIWWQYQLGILPKGCKYEPTNPYMKEELRHLEAIDTETRYLAQNKIETMADLKQDMEATQQALEIQLELRKKLRNKLRRARPEDTSALKKERDAATAQITALRKRLKTAEAIQDRSARIERIMEQIDAPTKQIQRKERNYER